MFIKVMLLPQKGQLAVSNTEEYAVCLMEKVVNLCFKNKSQMGETINKQRHLQSFLFFQCNGKKKKQYRQLLCMIFPALFKLQQFILKFFIPVMCFVLLSAQSLIEMDREEQRFSWKNF